MSQKKVDQYKEYKKNRTQILKRQKMMERLELTAAVVVAAVFVGWFGWSIYHNVTKTPEENVETVAEVVELDLTEYNDYVNGLQSTFTE